MSVGGKERRYSVGFWAYDAGAGETGYSTAGFSNPVLSATDDDDDGVIDDADNCEDAPNADQEDLDADGLGDACDADPGGDADTDADTDSDTDSDTDTESDADTDTDTDTGADALDPDGDGLRVASSCACDSVGGGLGIWGAAGALLLVRRRRTF